VAAPRRTNVDHILAKADGGVTLSEVEIVRLFAARDEDYLDVCDAADKLRARRGRHRALRRQP
jgi:hypothetical protein